MPVLDGKYIWRVSSTETRTHTSDTSHRRVVNSTRSFYRALVRQLIGTPCPKAASVIYVWVRNFYYRAVGAAARLSGQRRNLKTLSTATRWSELQYQ